MQAVSDSKSNVVPACNKSVGWMTVVLIYFFLCRKVYLLLSAGMHMHFWRGMDMTIITTPQTSSHSSRLIFVALAEVIHKD